MHFDAFIIVLLLNMLVALVLVFFDYFGLLGDAKDRKRCTNREWRKGTKGFRNTVTWKGIRKYVPKHLYVIHIITLTVIALGLLSPVFILFGAAKVTAYASLPIWLWIFIYVSFGALKDLWEISASSETSLWTSILAIISMLGPIALIAISVYKLLKGLLT